MSRNHQKRAYSKFKPHIRSYIFLCTSIHCNQLTLFIIYQMYKHAPPLCMVEYSSIFKPLPCTMYQIIISHNHWERASSKFKSHIRLYIFLCTSIHRGQLIMFIIYQIYGHAPPLCPVVQSSIFKHLPCLMHQIIILPLSAYVQIFNPYVHNSNQNHEITKTPLVHSCRCDKYFINKKYKK